MRSPVVWVSSTALLAMTGGLSTIACHDRHWLHSHTIRVQADVCKLLVRKASPVGEIVSLRAQLLARNVGSWPYLVKRGHLEVSQRFPVYRKAGKTAPLMRENPLFPSLRFPCSRRHQHWPRAECEPIAGAVCKPRVGYLQAATDKQQVDNAVEFPNPRAPPLLSG
jgi:hypothetical protein